VWKLSMQAQLTFDTHSGGSGRHHGPALVSYWDRQKLVKRSHICGPQAKYSPPSPPLASGNPRNVDPPVEELAAEAAHPR
jgi:hypothetical protein